MRGLFSLRSLMRPKAIGVTEVDLVEVRRAAVVVTGLGARDGSPLIDIEAVRRTWSELQESGLRRDE